MGTNIVKHRLAAIFAFFAAILVMVGVSVGVAAKPAMADTTTVVDDEVKRGQLIVMKYDAQTGIQTPQGGGDLAGATFTITNKSAASIVFIDENGHKLTKTPGESWDIEVKRYVDTAGTITGKAGTVYYAAQTAKNALPYGSYHVQEKSGSNGYGLVNKDNALSIDYIPGILKPDGHYEWIDDNNSNYTWTQRGYDFSVDKEGQIVMFDSTITMGDTANPDKSAAEGNYTQTAKSGSPAFNAGITYAGPAALNVPIRGEIHVVKIDHDLQRQHAQGNANLADTEFKIYNANSFAVTVWGHYDENLGHGAPLFDDANKDGWYEPGECVATIYSGDDGEAMTLQDALPVGWYKVVETNAPHGYGVETTNIRYVMVGNDAWQSGPITKIDDPILRGGVAFQKVDNDFGEAYAQGDASLAPATITIYNESDADVFIYEQSNDTAHVKGRVAPGGVVGVVQTNENGYAQLLQLPFGSYRAVETDPSTGYRVNSDWEFKFDITGANQTNIGSTPTITNDTQGKFVEVIAGLNEDGTSNTELREDVVRGNINGAKVDADTLGHVALGGATLEGAKISVTNVSKHDVAIYMDANGVPFEKDEDGNYTSEMRRVAPGEVVATLTTDAEGRYSISELPYGTYKLVEVKAPTGYMINKDWSATVEVREDGKTYDVSEFIPEDEREDAKTEGRYSALTDQVIREDITFTKIDENNQPVEGVAFRLTSKTTGESHILVTDKNGTLNTAAWLADDSTDEMGQPQWRMHTYNTNASDVADNGTGTIADSSLLTYDQGYWFYGFDEDAEANAELTEKAVIYDNRSALPWDTYTLEELRCDANVGKDLVKRDVTIDRSNNVLENLGTITNKDYEDDPCCVAVSPNSQGSKVELIFPQEGKQAAEGDVINYISNYENTGAETVESVQLRTYIPEGTEYVEGSATHDGVYVSAEDSANGRAYVEWTTDSYDPGQKDEFCFDVRVVSGARSIIKAQTLFEDMDHKLEAGNIENVDPTSASNVVRISTDGTKTGSNLYAEKSVEPASGSHVTTGDAVKYSVKITNKGDTAQNNVGIQDPLPQGFVVNQSEDSEGFTVYDISDGGKLNGGVITWQIGTLQPGESKTVTVAGTVGKDATHILNNQATYGVFAGGAYCDLPSTTNVAGLVVDKLPELSVTKTADVDYTVPSDIVTYTVHVVNNGEGNARNVPVFDIIPENARYVTGSVSIECNGVAASDENPYVSWVIPVIDRNGGSVDLTYQVRVNDDAAGKEVSNYAQVGGTEPLSAGSTEPTKNIDEPTFSEPNVLKVINPLDKSTEDNSSAVEIYKSADPADGSYVNAGDKITYTIDWENVSEHNVNGFAIRDVIPEGTTFVPGSIVVTGADGKTSTEIRDEQSAEEGDKPGVNDDVVPAPSEPESTTVWTDVTTIKVVDAEAVYDACVWDRNTQSIENWDEIRAWLETAQPGQSIEFTVTNTAWYNTLWHAVIQDDGSIRLLCRILVPNASDSANYVQANGVTGNYDQRDNAVYVLVNQLKPGQTGKVTFEVIVNEDVEFNTEIHNEYTYGAGIFGAPSGDLNNKGTNSTTHVVGEPKIEAHKSVSPEGYFNPSTDSLTYTVELTNNGTATAHDVAVFDQLPNNMVYVDGSYAVEGSDSAEFASEFANIDYSAPIIRAKASALAPGETLKVTFAAKVVDAKEGETVANKAFWDFNVEGTDFNKLKNETEEVSVTAESSKLGITLEASPKDGSSLAAGMPINYAITVSNDANVDAKGVSVVNNIPSYTEFVSSEDGLVASDDHSYVTIKDETIPAKGSKTYHFTVKVNEDAPAFTSITNTAYAGIVSASEVTSNTVSHTVLAPQVTLTKTSDPESGSNVTDGDIITYTIVAKNDGTFTARGIGIYDAIPTATEYIPGSLNVEGAVEGDGYVSGFVGDLEPGEEATMTFQVRVNGLEYGSIANTASWTYNQNTAPDKPSNNTSNTIGINYGTTDVVVVKSQDPENGAHVKGNDEITYTVELTNASQITADGVGMFEAIPEGVTYVPGSLKGEGIDVSEISDGENGPVTAVAAYAEHLNTGDTAKVTYKVKVNVGHSGHIASHATWDFNQGGMPAAKLLRLSNDCFATAEQPATLELVASVDPASGKPVAAGDVLTYTVEAHNTGDVDIQNVNISDMIPAGLTYVEGSADGGWAYADGKLVASSQTIPANGVATYTFQARVDKDAPEGTVFSNTAHAVTTSQPQVVSNTVSNTVVAPSINLVQVANPADGAEISAGDTITYTIKAINDGEIVARGVGIYDAIPEGTTYVEGSLTVSGAVEGDGYVAGYVGNIAPGEEATMTFKVTVNDNANGGISNVASWDYLLTEAPIKATANVSNKVTMTTEHADIEVVKTQDPADGSFVAPLDTINYTVRATNMGHANATGVGIFDAIPEGTTYVPGSLKVTGADGNEIKALPESDDSTSAGVVGSEEEADAANAKLAVKAVNAYAQTLEPGDSITMSFAVKVNQGVFKTIVSQASWNTGLSAAPDSALPRLSNDVDATALHSSMSIKKTQNPPTGSYLTGGDTLTYTVEVQNTGKVTAHNVGIYDVAPEHTTYVEGSLTGDGDAYVGEDGLLTIIAGDMAPGEKATMTFQAVIDLDFVGTIHNRALWVSPAADPVIVPDSGSDDESVEVQPKAQSRGLFGSIMSLFSAPVAQQTAALNVPIPDGADSGWSNDTGDPDDSGNTDNGDNTGDVNDKPSTGDNTGSDKPNTGDNQGNQGGNSGTTTHPVVPTPEEPGDGDSNLEVPDGNNGSSSNETVVNVIAPTLEVTKTSNPADGSYIKQGDTVSYTINVSNVGIVNANKLVLVDEIPSGITLDADSVKAEGLDVVVDGSTITATGNIASAASATITFSGVVNDTADGAVSNVVKWAQSNDGQLPEDESKIHVSNNATLNAVDPSLEVLKSASVTDGAFVAPGQEITYTVVATNKGEVNVTPTLVDVLDKNFKFENGSVEGVDKADFNAADNTLTMTLPELAPGQSMTITFKVTVDGKVEAGSVLNNVISWNDNGTDNAGTSNNFDVIVGAPVITATKSVVADTEGAGSSEAEADASVSGDDVVAASKAYVPGDVVNYKFVLTNTGNIQADVVATDQLPASVELVEGSLSDNAKYANGVITYEGMLAQGESVTVTYAVKILPGTEGQSIVNTLDAVVNGVEKDNIGGATINVADSAINLRKTVDNAEVMAGSILTYTIVAENSGEMAESGLVVTDAIPEGTTYVEGSASGNAEFANDVLTWNIGELAGGTSSDELTFKVTVDNISNGDESEDSVPSATITNEATYKSDFGEGVSNTVTTAATDVPQGVANVVLSKTVAQINGKDVEGDNLDVVIGDKVTYKLSAINTGSADATNALIIDAMGTGFDFGSVTTTPEATKLPVDKDGKFAYDDNGVTRVFQVNDKGVISTVDEPDYQAAETAERFAYVWKVDVAAGETTDVSLTTTIASGAPDEIVNAGASLNVGSGVNDGDQISNDTAKVEKGKLEVGKEAPQTGQSMMIWLLVAFGVAAIVVAGREFYRGRIRE